MGLTRVLIVRNLALFLAGLSLGAIPSAGAQRVTVAAVAPTAADDSLYRLAVDSATHQSEPTHSLYDATTVRVESDGSVVKTFRRVIQVLTEAGASRLREQQFGYVPGHQSFSVHWLRIVRPNGTVVSGAPTQVQESDVPAPVSTSPMYSDQKVVRMSLSGVATGTILDVEFAITEKKPTIPNDFVQNYVFTPGPSMERARLVLDVPASMNPRIREENLDFKRVTRSSNGRTEIDWARNQTPKIRPEPFAPDSNAIVMQVRVGGPLTWNDVSEWYAALARDRYATTPLLAHITDSLVAGARTRDDSIRAVHRWVAQDIRYVGIELGIGGYQPRLPDVVIATGFGDCKDKATLFVAALQHLGIRAFPVLLSISARAKRDLPSPQQFNHEIAALPQSGGGYHFVDLTSAFNSYDELPLSIQGGFALVVFPDGKNDQVYLPGDSPASNIEATRLAGTLSPAGKFDGYYEETAKGSLASGLRSAFASPLDSTSRAESAKRVVRRFFTTGEGDSVVGFNGRDYTAPAHVRVAIHNATATTSAGPVMLLNNPFGTLTSMGAMADDIAAMPARRFPIDASKIFGRRTVTTELSLTLPEGWHARIPAGVTASSVFGTYTTSYAQNGRELTMTRTLVGGTGVYMPSRITELLTWLRAIAHDDVKLIVLDRPAE